MNRPRQMVLGTYNLKKRDELQQLLTPLRVQLRTLQEMPDAIEVVEDGQTFAENAAKKATQQAMVLKQWVLAEDSGLCVDALGGAPGIYSARFAGESATDEANNHLLLEKLSGTSPEKRGAHYVCHMTLSSPQGEVVLQSEAKCHGRIATGPQGDHGFGYDPLFLIPEYGRTFGQLGPAVKGLISHRAKASRQFVDHLKTLLRQNPELLRQETK